ncbi:glycosylinositol phosphorylceramide mannosyl transferase 1 [Elaeis guineensis]|uniref:glycosyltransferase family 64 protein C4 n=1 Tax=Elaeis guineensis var. tenera TaxID=51953 RepID=A0A6I9RYA0_ELAGV|nr:glycosyltransferase family 64 protein C4 [Elaeis guineensis]XP_010930292.1 glycosyltransferase family 64 protein C4 [Elaeis guineensis]
MAAIMGLRDAASVAAAATSAGAGAIAAVSASAAALDATIAGSPYSPAKEKAASRGLGYPSRASFPLLLLRSRKLAGYAKARVLLVACVLLALFLVSRQVGPLMGWNYQPSSSVSSPSRGGYTILLNTWKRNSLLKRSVAHYASCLRVDAIHVVWSESDPPSDSLKAYLSKIVFSQSQSSHKPNFRFELNEEDDLNNRFKPIGDLKNDAIFSVDDDVIVPCPTLDFAFAVWQSSPDTMVGFVPRMHLLAEENGMPYYRYGGWWSVWWMGTYSMVLSKAAFFHRKYLDLYTYKMPSSIHEYVTRERNCEDIAMSLLVANATRAPPIWVKGKIYEIGGSGISSLKGHNKRRNRCLNDFFSLYGAVPLVPTSMKAVDAREEWFW